MCTSIHFMDEQTKPVTITRGAYSVAGVLPFWRYAVAIKERPDLPAIPFYRRASALLFRDEVRERFPKRTVALLKRTPRGLIEVHS